MSNAPLVTAATLPQQARVAANNSRGVSTLLYACQQGDVDKVRNILRAQPNAYLERDRTGKTALHYCCTSDHLSAAQAADVLVMAAQDLIENRDEDGFTPLHLAVIAGNIPLVTFLLANNADVNAVDNEKHTVVHWATVCGETVALRSVLAAGAPVSSPDVHGGYPLHYAAQMCGGEKDFALGLQVLHTLLAHQDINVSVEDGDGRQPILWAASAGSAKAILALIRAGSAVESHDKDGLTALHCSASRGHTDCLDTLLTLCGASPDVIDSNGCTALHYAVTLGHADATALLLTHSADPNRQDRKGRSPAHCGCAKGQFETVKMLGSHGANLWLRNARGDLPLHEAAASGRRDLVKWLLEMRPSQVNARNNDGRCPLHLAALNDNADMCKILLDTGAQINPVLRTSKNVFMTPLDCALQRGFRTTAKYLQLHGGVPANRLTEIPRNKEVGSAVSLHIRDDVTLWGDSSSGSEKEQVGKPKSKKRTYKRKVAYKYEKRKGGVVAATDYDSEKFANMKIGTDDGLNHAQTVGGSNMDQKEGINHQREFPFLGNNIPPGEIFIYANEVNINDKFGGKMQENREDTAKVSLPMEKTKSSGVQTTSSIRGSASSVSDKQERRPKSAKYGRLKNKPSRSSEKEDSARRKTYVDTPDPRRKQPSDESHQNEEDKTLLQTNVQYGNDKSIQLEENLKNNQVISRPSKDFFEIPADQQSARSNTSYEDDGEHKQLIVEASIHSPPKELNVILSNATLEANEISEERRKTPIGSENVLEESSERILKEDVKNIPQNKLEKELPVKTPNAETSSEHTIEATESSKMVTVVEQNNAKIVELVVEENHINTSAPVAVTPSPKVVVEQIEEEGEECIKVEISEDPTHEFIPNIVVEGASSPSITSLVDKEEMEINEQTSLPPQPRSKDEKALPDQTLILTPSPVVATASDSDVTKKESINKSNNIQERHDGRKARSQKDLSESETSSESLESKHNTVTTRERKSRQKQKSKTHKTDHVDSSDKHSPHMEKSIHQPKTRTKKKERASEDSSDEESSPCSSSPSNRTPVSKKQHKSFKILDEDEENDKKINAREKSSQRSRSEEGKVVKTSEHSNKEHERLRRSKIPTPITNLHTPLSKSDKHLERHSRNSAVEPRVPSLPNIFDSKAPQKPHRSVSNLSAPLVSTYSDNDRESLSDRDEISSATRKKRLRKRSKTRAAKSAGSDYESSNLIDSGFEPSPRSSRIPKWKHMSEKGVNMSSVTQTIQSNIRRYHLERKIFQHLLDLKRLQIRSGQHNEAVLVKRAIDSYHRSCAATVGAGKYTTQDYSFRSFEDFLYNSLRKIQRNGVEHLQGLPEAPRNPLHCTQRTHRCDHATHAYTGVPCAAYLPKMDHHTIPKVGFDCKPSGFLPKINQKNTVTLELCHGNDKQVISLPAERLDQNKRYYVTFTVKGNEHNSSQENNVRESVVDGHTHSKSD